MAGGLLAIIGKAAKGSSDSSSEEKDEHEAPESSSDMTSKCVDEAVAAAKEGDWDGFGDALKACFKGY